MAEVGGHDRAGATGNDMPVGLWRAALGIVALAAAGALYLVAVRGEALLLDLSTMSTRLLCW